MPLYDWVPENKEREPKRVLAIEDNKEVVDIYKKGFLKKMGLPVEVVPADNALIERRHNVSMIVVEPPTNYEIGNYILKLRDIYPSQPIIIASQRTDILSEIKDAKKFPNVSAITKPFHMEELEELAQALLSSNWKKEVYSQEKSQSQKEKKKWN